MNFLVKTVLFSKVKLANDLLSLGDIHAVRACANEKQSRVYFSSTKINSFATELNTARNRLK